MRLPLIVKETSITFSSLTVLIRQVKNQIVNHTEDLTSS